MTHPLSAFVKNLTTKPGIYQMINKKGEVLYVGKAKNLKKRVSSYFVGEKEEKIKNLLNAVNKIEVTITTTEQDAYILENSLIKELKPKYNVIFRDDKSYPYILITNEEYPAIKFYRKSDKFNNNKNQKNDKNNKKKKNNDANDVQIGKLFGPYPSSKSVKESIDFLRKNFLLRNCNKATFSNRTRPCLQYQIKRCSAPCVNYISKKEYHAAISKAKLFLSAKTSDLIEELVLEMDENSTKKNYEKAAKIRDQIINLKTIQKSQNIISADFFANIDVIALAQEYNLNCFHVLSIRTGKIVGSRQFFVKTSKFLETNQKDLITSFIMQNYTKSEIKDLLPSEILISVKLDNRKIIEDSIFNLISKKIKINDSVKLKKAKWLEIAVSSAEKAINLELKNQIDYESWFDDLSKKLKYKFSEIVCFDISHNQGDATTGAMVSFNEKGPIKSNYRKFNIKTTNRGDDYAAMKEVLSRFVKKALKQKIKMPELILIDGGLGQLKIAKKVLDENFITNVKLIAIAKGKDRKPGLETVYLTSNKETEKILQLSFNDMGFLLLLNIRDEAHRFAITGHRNKKLKTFKYSKLEDIPGIGPKKRKDLLCHFGGLQEIEKASIDEISKVHGFSSNLAKRIYDILHGN